MKTSHIVWLAIGGALVVLLLIVWGGYNSLVGGQENVKNKWADVQTQYQRRVDLIPRLVETVKGSAQFEQQTLTQIVEARSAWAKSQSGGINDQLKAASQFDSALSRLLVTVEAYPQLKSTEGFRDFMTQLEGTENRVAVARKDFNGSVKEFNVMVRRFPSNVVAGLFGFSTYDSFKADEGAEKAPDVNFVK